MNRYVNRGMGRKTKSEEGFIGQKRSRGSALAVRESAGEAMNNFEDQIDKMTVSQEEEEEEAEEEEEEEEEEKEEKDQ